jgi:hypothetical protein
MKCIVLLLIKTFSLIVFPVQVFSYASSLWIPQEVPNHSINLFVIGFSWLAQEEACGRRTEAIRDSCWWIQLTWNLVLSYISDAELYAAITCFWFSCLWHSSSFFNEYYSWTGGVSQSIEDVAVTAILQMDISPFFYGYEMSRHLTYQISYKQEDLGNISYSG